MHRLSTAVPQSFSVLHRDPQAGAPDPRKRVPPHVAQRTHRGAYAAHFVTKTYA